MKKLVCLLLAAVLLLPLSACKGPRPGEAQKSTILIGVSVYDGYDAFISVMMGWLRGYARELEAERDVTITVLERDAGGNQFTQNTQVEGFIDQNFDIICVNLVDRTESSVIIDKAEAAGIPILFFNRELVEEDLERGSNLYYVGAEAEQSGILQGEILIQALEADFAAIDKNGDGALQYVMLEGEAGHQDAIVRTEYSVNTVTDAGYTMARLGAEIANWSRAQAETKMNGWLTLAGQMGDAPEDGWPAIEVVFCNNDEMALGTIDALRKSGLPDEEWPVVLGIDGTPDGLDAVARGQMLGTVFNDAAGQAYGLVDLAWALAMGEEMPPDLTDGKYIRLPYQIVTAENVDEYLAMYRD